MVRGGRHELTLLGRDRGENMERRVCDGTCWFDEGLLKYGEWLG